MTNLEDVMHAVPTDSWVSARELAESLGTDIGWMGRKLFRLYRQGWVDRRGNGRDDDPYMYSATDSATVVTRYLFEREERP